MMVDELARSWRVELFNEDHPSVFEHWWLRELDRVDAALDASRARVAVFKPILDTPSTKALLDRHDDSRAVFMSRSHTDVVRSAMLKFGPDNWSRRVAGWMRGDFGEFRRWGVPAETAAAVRRLWRPALDCASATAVYWFFYNRLFFDLGLDGADRCRLALYEDVTLDPRRELRAIERFIGVDLGLSRRDFSHVSQPRARDAPLQVDAEIEAACAELRADLQRVARSRDHA